MAGRQAEAGQEDRAQARRLQQDRGPTPPRRGMHLTEPEGRPRAVAGHPAGSVLSRRTSAARGHRGRLRSR
ncbi:MAG: hypothetical protein ACK55I_31620, partial [bacterium]